METGGLEYLESIIENITDIITILEVDGKIRYESSSIRSSLGYEPQEMVGLSAFDFIHPDDREKIFKVFLTGSLIPSYVSKVEFRFRHKDGSWRILEAMAKNLLFDPRVRGVVVSSRDITERKRLEEQIHLQVSALEATANGVVITDLKGLIVWTNHAFSQISGYSREEVLGKNPRVLKSGEQPASFYKNLWETIVAGNIWTGEMINRRKDGTLYFESMMITPIRNQEGEITHFVAIKQDISEHKKLEAQFRQAQKMEAVGRLAGGVAHDFNNLLTIILGRAEFLSRRFETDASEYVDVEEIRQAGVRASHLTRQLLAFSRKQVLQTKVTQLNTIVLGTDKMIRRLMGEDIELVTVLGENLKQVKVDAGQVEQMIMNLVVNARDAMVKGGKLVIETRGVLIETEEALLNPGLIPGDYILMTIRDTGSGMTEDVKNHIFEPFFTTKEKGKGTGLGLSTVYGIVKQLQGFIYVDSEINKGTTFRIYFPTVSDFEAEKMGTITSSEIPGGKETILLVEDEEIVRGIVFQSLTRQGYQVIEARNGLEALRMAKGYQGSKIQMLLTDMVMPHMGGSELAEKFSLLHPDAKIIFTSGYTDQNAIQRWIDQGCRFLQKPYTPSELLFTVREVFDSKKTVSS